MQWLTVDFDDAIFDGLLMWWGSGDGLSLSVGFFKVDSNVLSTSRCPSGHPPIVAMASAPVSPGGSSVAAWAEPPLCPDSAKTEFVEKAIRELGVLSKLSGGPANYLQEQMPDPSHQSDFATFLWNTFPEADDALYHHSGPLPNVSDDDLSHALPVCVHVAALGYHKNCSLKPPPGSSLFGQLTEQILMDGFLTSGDPLLVVQPTMDCGLVQLWPPEVVGSEPLRTASLGYVKGMARTSSLLMLLHYCFKNSVDLKTVHPQLYTSVLKIFVHHMPSQTKQDEALKNLKLSARGSIRKMANVIQIAQIIKNLCEHGMNDFTGFVRKWNQMSGRSHQIVGRRAMSLKLLFEQAPEDSSLSPQ
jgi:hypothetical protein